MNYIIPFEVTRKFKERHYKEENVFYCKVEKMHHINRHGTYNNVPFIKFATDIFNFEKTFLEASSLNYANSEFSNLEGLKEVLKSIKYLKKYSWYTEFKDILNKIKFRKSKDSYSTITNNNLFERYNAISQQMFYDLNIFFTSIIDASVEFEEYKNSKKKPKKRSKVNENETSDSSSRVDSSTIKKILDLSDRYSRGGYNMGDLSNYMMEYNELYSRRVRLDEDI